MARKSAPAQSPMDTDNSEEQADTPKTPMGQPAPKPAAQPKGGMPTMLIAGVVLIIIVLAAVYFLVLKGGSSNALVNVLSASKINLTAVANVIAQKVNASTLLNISYTGTATVSTSGSSLGNVQLSIPLKINYLKYYNDSRIYINATGIPLVGNTSIIVIVLANKTTYTCIAYSASLGSAFGQSSNSGYKCQAGHGNLTSSLESSGISGSSEASRFLNSTNITTKFVGTEQYNGQACELLIVNGVYTNSTTGTAKANVSTCLSQQYYVPLNMTMQVNASSSQSTLSSITGIKIGLTLNEVSIGQSTTEGAVTTLPGPVTTSFGSTEPVTGSTGTTGTTGYNYSTTPTSPTTPSVYGTGNLMCAGLSAQYNCSGVSVTVGPSYSYNNGVSTETNGTFANLWFGQDTGQAWNDVNMTFVPSGTAVTLNSTGAPNLVFGAGDSVSTTTVASSRSSIDALFVNLPISANASPGSYTYTGTLWARYFTSAHPGWQYSEVANVTINATAVSEG
jgi:hypothetical protein